MSGDVTDVEQYPGPGGDGGCGEVSGDANDDVIKHTSTRRISYVSWTLWWTGSLWA